MNTVFLGLANLSHFSDILRGKTISFLAEKYRVIVLTPDIDEKKAKKEGYPVLPNVTYHPYHIRHKKIWDVFDVYLRQPLIREYDQWDVISKWFYRKDQSIEIRTLNTIGSFLPRRFPNTAFFTALELLLADTSGEFIDLLRAYKPRLMITATPGCTPFEAEMIINAKTLGIPTVAINVNIDNMFSNAKVIRPTDYLMVWNEIMKKESAEYNHYPAHNIFISGCLRFDHYFNDLKEKNIGTREEFLKSKGLDPAKKTIVYATSTPIAFPSRKEFMEELTGLKENKLLAGNPNILVRLHPHDTWDAYEPFTQIKGVHIERAGEQKKADSPKGQKIEMKENDLINLTETMRYCDVFINFSSTTTMEAFIFDKPVISLGFPTKGLIMDPHIFYDFEINQAYINQGGMKVAYNTDELINYINDYLENPEKERDMRKNIVRNFVYHTDGLSWKRTVDFIGDIINTDH